MPDDTLPPFSNARKMGHHDHLWPYKGGARGAADNGVSEALYLRDPDGNGVELYWTRPREEWPRSADGELTMFTKPLDLQALLASADGAAR